MNDNAAVALYYGTFHQKEFSNNSLNVLFYDQGAHSTTASIVEYSFSKQRNGFLLPVVKMLSVANDKHLGGYEYDVLLSNHFAEVGFVFFLLAF